MFERRMKLRRPEKSEAVLTQRARGLLGRKIDGDAERLQHVRAAGLRGDGAIAVLGDGDARGGAENRGGGGDVERVQSVAAGAAHIEDLAGARGVIERHGHGHCAQRVGEGGDLLRRLAFAGERAEKIRLYFGRDGFGDKLRHGVAHLIVGQGCAAHELAGQFAEHGGSLDSKRKVQSSKCERVFEMKLA